MAAASTSTSASDISTFLHESSLTNDLDLHFSGAVHQAGVHFAGGVDVQLGQTLMPEQAAQLEKIEWSTSADDALYAVLVLDPDAPSRRRPLFRSVVHAMYVNTKGGVLKLDQDGNIVSGNSGAVRAKYHPPGPPPKTGGHRYTFLVYRQAQQVDESKLPTFTDSNRMSYKGNSAEKAIIAAGAGSLTLVAANWFLSEHSEWVTEQYKKRMGFMAHIIIPIISFIARI